MNTLQSILSENAERLLALNAEILDLESQASLARGEADQLAAKLSIKGENPLRNYLNFNRIDAAYSRSEEIADRANGKRREWAAIAETLRTQHEARSPLR